MRPKDIVILLAPIGIVVLCLIVAPLLLLPNGIRIGTNSQAVPVPGAAGGAGPIGGGGAPPGAPPGTSGSTGAPASTSGSPVPQGGSGGGSGDAANGAKLFVTKG